MSDEGFDLKKRILCLYPSAEASYLSVSPTKPEGKRHSKARQLLTAQSPFTRVQGSHPSPQACQGQEDVLGL